MGCVGNEEERPTWNLQRVLKGLVEEKQETWLDREWIPDDSLPPGRQTNYKDCRCRQELSGLFDQSY